MKNPSEWPENIVLKPSKESSDEAKLIKEVLMKTMEKPKEDALWTLMEKFSYWKAIRVTAWANWFLVNCKQAKRHIGPLSTTEVEVGKQKECEKFNLTKMRLVILAALLLLSFIAVSHGGKFNDGEEERNAMENDEVEDLDDQYEVAEEDPEGLERDLPRAEPSYRRRRRVVRGDTPYAELLRGFRRKR